jgi:hypothetical protein
MGNTWPYKATYVYVFIWILHTQDEFYHLCKCMCKKNGHVIVKKIVFFYIYIYMRLV